MGRPLQTSDESPTVRVLSRLADVDAAAWDALVPPGSRPFLTHAFLSLLEESGSAVDERGWQPRHLTLWRGPELVAAAPAYLKSHSMGEFFYNDFRWAELTPRFGVRYYPKLVVTAPFTPIASPKLLARAGADAAGLRRALAKAAKELAVDEGCSSAAVLFASDDDRAACDAEAFAPGAGIQFQWKNQGYRDFDDFLGRFNAKRRRMIRDERAQLSKDGTTVRTLFGDALDEAAMELARRCYEATTDAHAWGVPHLTPTFFRELPRALPGEVELVVAEENGRRLASALNLRGARRLFGRHWGALDERRFLHFNVCYYHSIERAIADGLHAFEPGAGGEHKLSRGFEPTVVHSAHWFSNPRLREAMRRPLEREAAAVVAQAAGLVEAEVAFRSGRG